MSNSIIFTTKQTKAIKVLINNLDSDYMAVSHIKYGFRNADAEGMTLEEARRIVDRMNQDKKDAVNDILSGKVQPHPQAYYRRDIDANQVINSKWITTTMCIFIMVVAILELILV